MRCYVENYAAFLIKTAIFDLKLTWNIRMKIKLGVENRWNFFQEIFFRSLTWLISIITKTIFSLTVQSSSCFISFHIKNGYSLRAHTIIPGKLFVKEILFSLKLGKSFVLEFFLFNRLETRLERSTILLTCKFAGFV